MIKDSMQQILLNEFDDKSKFYKLFEIEFQVRYISESRKNTY